MIERCDLNGDGWVLTPRVRCPQHGVVVAEVPWARRASRFILRFEEETAWHAAKMSSSTVAERMRTTWRSVLGIVTRVTEMYPN